MWRQVIISPKSLELLPTEQTTVTIKPVQSTSISMRTGDK
jgi:hypothetical protein